MSIPAEQCAPYPSKAKRQQSKSSAQIAETGGVHQRQGDRGSGEDDTAVRARQGGGGRWARNATTARYLRISSMTLWRWKHDPRLNFPAAARINEIEYNNLDRVDDWMESNVVSRLAKESAA